MERNLTEVRRRWSNWYPLQVLDANEITTSEDIAADHEWLMDEVRRLQRITIERSNEVMRLEGELERCSGDAAALTISLMEDWTRNDKTGRSNSSDEFLRLKAEIARLIRNDAFTLINGGVENTAGLILAQLAHKQGMRPVHLADAPTPPEEA